MLDRSGIGSEVVAHNSIPDDPYQPNGGEEEQRYEDPKSTSFHHTNPRVVRAFLEPPFKAPLTTS